MLKTIATALTPLDTLTASTVAFLIVIAYAASWPVFHPSTFEWLVVRAALDDIVLAVAGQRVVARATSRS